MLVALLLLSAAGSLFAQDQSEVEAFRMGNKFYEEKDYASATRMYQSILAQGLESAELYFNLGNACFKGGDLGHAIVYYLKAQRLDPGNDDISHNLEFARRFSRVQMEGVALNPVSSFLSATVAPYSLNTLAWASSLLVVLLTVLLMFRWGLGFTAVTLRAGITAMVVLLIVSASLTTFKYRHDYLTRRAVIIAEESPVHTGASEQSDIELQGAPGLVVEILEESGDYYNVLFENKRRGWIRKDLVAEV